MSRSPDVVVVGGGIVGIAVAASCARRGLRVTLCEAAGLAQAASGRNQGLVIGPHHPAMESIGRSTLELFLDLHERSGHAFAFDRDPHGCLILSPEGGDRLTAAELRAAEPLLAPHIEYAELNLDARRIDPGAAAAALADDARAAGAEIRTGCAVRELLRRGDDVIGVLADDGRIEAEHSSWLPGRGRGACAARSRTTSPSAACAAGSSSPARPRSGCGTRSRRSGRARRRPPPRSRNSPTARSPSRTSRASCNRTSRAAS